MPKAQPLRIATRSSELALRQARLVQSALAARGVACELVTYSTVGDKRLDQPLSVIGGKGLFTQELEADLANGAVDCCVHSLKDLPTEMPRGLTLVATLEREDPRDVLVMPPGAKASTLADLPHGARVGTSSLRRRAQLSALRPDVQVVDLRGNVPTRLRKIDEGQVDAAILAAAGLVRLGSAERIAAYIDGPEWLPAAGQGAIAVQIRQEDDATRALLAPLNHSETWNDVAAERAFLAALEGGCQVPIGALVMSGSSGARTLHGFVSDVDGRRAIHGSRRVDAAAPESTGRELAAELLAQGAGALLGSVRDATDLPSPQPE